MRNKPFLGHGSLKRKHLGSGRPVRLSEGQRASEREVRLLVVAVTPGAPAADAGLPVVDPLLDFDGQTVESTEDLFDLHLVVSE